MNHSEKIYPAMEFEFGQETVKRHLQNNPQSAVKIALKLLGQLKEQRQKQHQLEQKYNELLTGYLDVNDAYLAALRLLKDESASATIGN